MAIEGDLRRFSRIAALRVWESVWAGIERLVIEARETLGSHLRDGALDARRLPGDGEREIGELVIGRTRLRLECTLDCGPAEPHEPLLHDVFGPTAPLARVQVLRETPSGAAVLDSMLAADPASGLWVSTNVDLPPAHLEDLPSFEIFFWSLVTDRSAQETTRALPAAGSR
jgi:hypothetical protein